MKETKFTYGSLLIARERQRQIEVEGYSSRHDFRHTVKEFVCAALSYLHDSIDEDVSALEYWPWLKESFKRKGLDGNLVRAGALIAAAIDRINSDGRSEAWVRDDVAVKTDKSFITQVWVRHLAGDILYIVVNTVDKWLEYQLFKTYPGRKLAQISFYEGDQEYSETFKVDDGFDQFDYVITSSQEKDQITIVCIPIRMLLSSKKREE